MMVGTARESRLGADSGARGERREKLHPFESHLRTPSSLKKSIKRREARHRKRQPGRRVKGIEEKRERVRWDCGRTSEQTALSSG